MNQRSQGRRPNDRNRNNKFKDRRPRPHGHGPGHGPGRGHGPRPEHGRQNRDNREPRPYDGPRTPGVLEPAQGVLELHPKGYGFLRQLARNYAPQPSDAYVPAQLIQKFNLREGMLLSGTAEAGNTANGPRLVEVDKIEDYAPDQYPRRSFDDLTPIDPHQQIVLETGTEPLTTRVMDMITPVGKGTRGLIVAPPRTGKTILLQHIAQAVVKNHPEMHLIMLLVDERPEEVTEMRRTVKGEVVASSADRDSSDHIRTAQIVTERARRLTEQGKEVFLLLDSLTRLSRAYNKHAGNSGRTLSGGIDSRAMEVPRRMFGTARVFEEGGSLTVLATCLIDTGSRMDDYIFQEFKGTGNMELVLDRKLSDRRIFPAIDILQSGTRKEERILPAETHKRVTLLRRSLAQLNPVMAMESLVSRLGKFKTNDEFLEKVASFIK
ncbi:MAG: transcription termination factor Rho [Planctomycetes bacterium]|nr:transcription termination factor Rho [Planctomycetota bacterium]